MKLIRFPPPIKEPTFTKTRGRDTRFFRGYLAEPYDGIGQYILVTLSKGSSAVATRSRIAAGDFATKTKFPEGTPVVIFSDHGRLEVLSLGTKVFAIKDSTSLPPDEPPPPPPPCGITDTFDRDETTMEEGLGISDSTLPWGSGTSFAEPTYLLHIDSLAGTAPGYYFPDYPGDGPSWSDYPHGRIQVPGIDNPGPPFGPGPSWPVPFRGKIMMMAYDSFPGFSGPDFATGWPWRGLGNGHNFNGELASVYRTSGNEGVGSPGFFSPYETLLVSGRIRLDESGLGAPGVTLEDYIDLRFGVSGPWGSKTASVVFVDGPPGSDDSVLTFSDLGFDDQSFPAGYWSALDGAWVDFSIEYTGGFGGTLTVTVGPCTLSRTLDADQLVTDVTVSGDASYGGGPTDEPSYDIFFEDPVEVNERIPETAILWQWITHGGTGAPSNKTLRYTFTYYTYGMSGGYSGGPPNGYENGDVDYGDPDGEYAAVMGPLIMVRIEHVSNSTPGATILSSVVSWLELDEDLPWPIEPIVDIDTAGAELTISGFNVRADNINAVDPTTGASEPLGAMTKLQGSLRMDLVNGLGTFMTFNNLDIDGVNRCTVPDL